MPVTQARLPGFQSAKSARWYQALIGPIQATGSAGGFDSFSFLHSEGASGQHCTDFHQLKGGNGEGNAVVCHLYVGGQTLP